MKLHLGQPTKKKGWVTIDIFGTPDIKHNLNKGLPKLNGKVTEVCGMHVLEHLKEPKKLLKDIYKILELEGKAIFELPDIEGVFREYLRTPYGDRRDLMLKYVYGEGSRKGQHHYWGWSDDALATVMRDIGFKVKIMNATDGHAEEAPCFRVEATK